MGVLSPIELRARMALGYLEAYRRAGIDADEREMQRLAIADCELVDAARRNGELQGPPPAAHRTELELDHDRERPAPLLEAQRETNTRLTVTSADEAPRRQRRRQRPRALYRNPMLESARWGAAVARIQRILEGAAKSTSLLDATRDAELGPLARAFGETYAYYMTRAMPPPARGIDHNPFRHLSDRDASRMFMRQVEDICDRSSRQLGSWYVK